MQCGKTMLTNLDDVDVNQPLKLCVRVKNEDNDGLAVSLDGYSTKTRVIGFDDAVIYLEMYDGSPRLLVWADINSEDPTHIIDLSGAHVSLRDANLKEGVHPLLTRRIRPRRRDFSNQVLCGIKRFKGHLYWRDEEGELRHIAQFDEHAATQIEAEHKILDNHWSYRLDAASCAPHFVWE